jgi:hypothetical protein
MREFTKSVFSFSWAMSVFGVQQMANLMKRPDPNRPRGPAAEAFEGVTRATEDQLGRTLGETFRAGDKFQRAMVDMMLGPFMRQGAGGARGMMDRATEAMGQAMGQAGGCCGGNRRDGGRDRQQSTGWGPMPASEGDAS